LKSPAQPGGRFMTQSQDVSVEPVAESLSSPSRQPLRARIVYWSITSALAGFIFGFDTVVISGAEQTIQRLWGLSDLLHGLAMGSALYGTVLGSVFGGLPTDYWGRRRTLIVVGVLYMVSALGSGAATDVGTFVIARFLGGVGIGISTIVAPLYISEIAPAPHRGRLAGMFQFNIVLGILVAFGSNALIAHIGGEAAWRWMLGIAAIPSLVYLLMCFGLPESPRWWLTHKKGRAMGLTALRLVEPALSEVELRSRAAAIMASASDHKVTATLWQRSLRVPIQLAFLVAFFNQLSGINAVLYFAPRIFEMTGLGKHAALLQSVGIGVTNLVFTFLGLWLIDWLGRRTLLYIGSFGYIGSLGLTAWAFFSGHSAFVPTFIFAFCAAHAVGQGTVIWVLISEIFPNRFRAQGQALGSFTHWFFAAALTTFFPQMVTRFAPGYVFLFFCLMMVLQLIWVRFWVPETKGVALEEIEQKFGDRIEATR
jgi:MFS transporter, SP family, arabinose:H+ symporter